GRRTCWFRASSARSGRNWCPPSSRSRRCWTWAANIACRLCCGSSCVRISQLEGKRVALWGWGREGRAAYQAIRARLPRQPLTLFCNAVEAVETETFADANLRIGLEATAALLGGQDVVVKSPGISPYSEVARAAIAQGARFVGGSTLWFDEQPDSDGFA